MIDELKIFEPWGNVATKVRAQNLPLLSGRLVWSFSNNMYLDIGPTRVRDNLQFFKNESNFQREYSLNYALLLDWKIHLHPDWIFAFTALKVVSKKKLKWLLMHKQWTGKKRFGGSTVKIFSTKSNKILATKAAELKEIFSYSAYLSKEMQLFSEKNPSVPEVEFPEVLQFLFDFWMFASVK